MTQNSYKYALKICSIGSLALNLHTLGPNSLGYKGLAKQIYDEKEELVACIRAGLYLAVHGTGYY